MLELYREHLREWLPVFINGITEFLPREAEWPIFIDEGERDG